MKPLKPLFLKTYGKQSRKLPTWLSPDNRKQAFDSTASTDGDISVFEPAKPTRIRGRKTGVASGRTAHPARTARPAKKKAMLCLTEKSYDEDNITPPSCPQHAQQSKMTRGRKTVVSRSTEVHPVSIKATSDPSETSDNEEDIGRFSPHRRKPTQQSDATRKSRFASVPGVTMRQKGRQVSRTSEGEEDSMSTARCQKNSNSNDPIPSAGRFVTRRRRAVAAKRKLPKATLSSLNSSDDFTFGAFGSSRIARPSRKRRVPPAFVVSSAENSLNAAGTANVATNPFREISLNESADHSLGPCSRKPIFCSTPSAGPFSKRPRLKPISVNDQSSTSPSISVSCIGVLSTFQEDPDSPGQVVSPPCSAPANGLHSEEKLKSRHGEQDSSGELFMEATSNNKQGNCSEEAKSHSDIQTKNDGEFPSLDVLSKDYSKSSSPFVTAAAGLEWLIDALKEKCLTERCTVQMERLYNLTVTQLCSQTTYSSCLGHSSSVHSQNTDKHPLSVDSIQNTDLSQSSELSFNLHLSVSNNKRSSNVQSVNGFESPECAGTMADSECTNSSSSADCTHSSSKETMEQAASAPYVESSHHTDSSVEFMKGTQLPANFPVQARFTKEDAVAAKEQCLSRKYKVQLKKCTLSPQHLKELMQQKYAGLACDKKPANPDANRSENDHTHNINEPEHLTHSGEVNERMLASVGQPVNSSSPAAQTQTNGSETQERAAALTAVLKDKCLTDKLIVEVKRVTLSQLKDILLLKDRKVKSPTDVSDSGSDDQTRNHHQSKSDTNHFNEETDAMKVSIEEGSSTNSEHKIASHKEKAINVSQKREKNPKAPKGKKRRSVSTDRPGTTRKACVSGLSVSRWKNKDGASTHVTAGSKALDCSINELLSQRHRPRELLGTTMNFSTPLRVSRLNLSSLLADFTPSTHTWSRIKAALSVHRKGMVLHTPKGSRVSVLGTPVRSELADVSQDLFATPFRTPFRTPLPSRLRSQLLSCGSLVECEDADLSDAEKVYAECGQQRPLPWEECILPQRMKQCVKIGEGTFGEVFSTTDASGDTVALKVIPVEGSEKVNGEDQKTFGEILHEIIISKELSSLKEKQQNQTHGFIGLNDLHCVQGCYPPDFMNAWDTFNQQKGSENDRPDFFEADQLFIILEFEFGGIDLENSNGMLTSIGVAKSILHQVTAALAVAEEELHFEHRDLHWGNVLVKTTKKKKGSFLLNGAAHSLETKGVLVRIIDYSLSRLEIDDLTVSCDISEDEELFMGHGDYQFDIYRLMRQENGNNWSSYHPHTNVLWLHYLCSKLLSMKYRGSGGKGAKDVRAELTRFYDNVLQYSSATEALQNCPMFQ